MAVLLTASQSGSSGRQTERAIPSFLGSLTRISIPASGVLTDTLINLGVSVYDAERYERRVQNGGVLMYVRCGSPGWLDRVGEILKLTGAEDISPSRDARAQIRAAHVEQPYAPELTIRGSGAVLVQSSASAMTKNEI
ncbi:MAG TPA: hypothetical protein VN785_07695 [Candidatus Angelobacter sp.]|nr:hypothetical protein [Candidatus Angelobacter sp.]